MWPFLFVQICFWPQTVNLMVPITVSLSYLVSEILVSDRQTDGQNIVTIASSGGPAT